MILKMKSVKSMNCFVVKFKNLMFLCNIKKLKAVKKAVKNMKCVKSDVPGHPD